MKPTARPVVTGASSLLLLLSCGLTLLPSIAPGASSAASENGDLSQAIIAYGFLVSQYSPNLSSSQRPTAPLVLDMKRLDDALSSLGCNVPNVLAFPHKAILVPSSVLGQWLGPSAVPNLAPQEGLLFVAEWPRLPSARALVVLSGVAPDETTVFWFEGGNGAYQAKLVYDSFKMGTIRNAPNTNIGAVTAIRLESSRNILLREWAEPGSRPGHMGAEGRVFRVNLFQHTATLVSSGTTPR